MKKKQTVLISVLAGIFFSWVAYAQEPSGTPAVPRFINYQGRLLDNEGVPKIGIFEFVFSLQDPVGNEVWTETHSLNISNEYSGLFSVLLGSISPFDLSDFPIDRDVPGDVLRYLQVSVGTNLLSPKKEFVSVAYAFRASDADTLDGYHATNFYLRPDAKKLFEDRAVNDKTNKYVLFTDGTNNYWDSEKDPEFTASPAAGITSSHIINWHTAYGWSNHADVGYLTEFEEKDTIFTASAAAGITSSHILNWNTAYDWGDHAEEGYLKSFTEVDPKVGPMTDHYVPRWDGSAGKLLTGRIYDNPSKPGIGIGTTDPGTKLHIKASANDGINIDTAGWGTNAFTRIFFREGGSPDYGGVIGYDPAMDLFRLTTLENGTEKYGLSIKRASGNVGINTWDPQDKLDVNGNAIVRGTMYLTTGDYRIQSMAPASPSGVQPFLVFYSPQPLTEQTITYKTVVIPPSGGFIVSDSANTRYNIHVLEDGRLFVQSDVHANNFIYHGSDKRLKSERKPLNLGLSTVMNLKPEQYQRSDAVQNRDTGKIEVNSKSARKDLGLVAQDMYSLIPEAVYVPEDESRDIWKIDYSKIVTVMVKAMQEQQRQIETLQQQLREQQGEVRNLHDRLTLIENKLK